MAYILRHEHCSVCEKPYSITRLRHTCRKCHRHVCNECCPVLHRESLERQCRQCQPSLGARLSSIMTPNKSSPGQDGNHEFSPMLTAGNLDHSNSPRPLIGTLFLDPNPEFTEPDPAVSEHWDEEGDGDRDESASKEKSSLLNKKKGFNEALLRSPEETSKLSELDAETQTQQGMYIADCDSYQQSPSSHTPTPPSSPATTAESKESSRIPSQHKHSSTCCDCCCVVAWKSCLSLSRLSQQLKFLFHTNCSRLQKDEKLVWNKCFNFNFFEIFDLIFARKYVLLFIVFKIVL